jgi:Uma2 family endonuclease
MAAMVQERIEQVPRGEYVPDADNRVVMYNLDWDRFEQLLAIRGDRSQPRMAYLDGAIELMSPSRDHEAIKSKIGMLVETYLYELGIVFEPVGSWSIKHRPDEAGAEPDECYLVPYDPSDARHDRPDVVIEVVWTSGGIDKLEIYRRLGVPEVWFWIDGAITVHVLDAGGYDQRSRSARLPDLDLELLCRLLELPTVNEAVRELRATLSKA